MVGVKRGLTLVGLLLAIAAGGARVLAQTLATTAIQDVVNRADGTPAGGNVLVSWNAFTTASGTAVTAGTTSVTIGAGGVLTLALAPNSGSTPMGSYYTAVFHLNDGTTAREYWAVPATVAGSAPVKLAAISTQVLPTSVAMQTVSKAYVDNAIAAAQAGVPFDASPYVVKAGDTMTGPLVLPGDPVSVNQAADMHYVDASVAAVAAGLAEKVSVNPTATQVVSQPVGTELAVNQLNGELYASQYVSGGGADGIAGALTSADCTAGCEVKVEQTYPQVEQLEQNDMPQMSHVEDDRGGARTETALDPLARYNGGASTAHTINNLSARTAAQLSALNPGAALSSYALQLQNTGLNGGSNQFPEGIESPAYFKSTYGVEYLRGVYNTQGQHIQVGNEINCYAVGDCLAGGQFITSEGGYRDSADEGTHPYDLSVTEDTITFTGVCTSGCTTGSTSVLVAATVGGGRQGDGRFLIDKNPAHVITSGALVTGGLALFGTATFSGTSFPVSVFLQTSQAATSQPTNMSPGTVTLGIATSGVPAGFATNTAALSAPSGVACVADPTGLPNFETANYTVVDGTHVQLILNKVHELGATIAVGGLCGYGVDETVDTQGPLRQVFPVVGSTSATSLYYAQGITPVLGVQALTGGFLNVSMTVASIVRSANVVTVTTTADFGEDVQGLTMTVSGVTDSSYNGSFVVSTTGPNTLTYPNTGSNSTSNGGTVSLLTGGFEIFPMAEVLSVYDPATKTVDGLFTLAPNTIAFASGDAVEEPHYYQQRTNADMEYITQYLPRPQQGQSAGKTYGGLVGPGLGGWDITNAEPATDYIGSGGTHYPPANAYGVEGVWSNDFDVEAGQQAVMSVHCSSLGCGRWDSTYNLFALHTDSSVDTESFAPQTHTVTWILGGSAFYTFSQTAFTASTIDVGTLNATTITGGVSGSSITGTISAGVLPLFGPSGTTHAPGMVPDPGATAGATRFLREDGTWDAPAGGSGSNYWSLNPTTNDIYSNNSSNEVGIGTSTPGQWSSVNVTGSGTNFQVASTTGSRLIVAGPTAEFHFVSTTAPAGEKNWRMYADPTGDFTMAMNTDNYSGSTMAYQCTAVGYCTFPNGLAANLLHEALTTPASSAAACSAGDFTDDANYHYVCVAANTWKRAALSSF